MARDEGGNGGPAWPRPAHRPGEPARHLTWGAARDGAGTEAAEAFWWRVYVTPAARTVVVLADGSRWIWDWARAFLGLSGVGVVEIVDIYHADGYLRAVGHALHGCKRQF